MVRWSPTATFEGENITVIKEGEVPANDMSVSATFTIPEAKYGANYIQFVRVNRDDPVNVQFNIKPSMTISPGTVTPGENITITGHGFAAEDSGTITFDGEETDLTFTPDELGTFTVEYSVPDLPSGDHKFEADSPKLYTETSTAVMEIVPVSYTHLTLPTN